MHDVFSSYKAGLERLLERIDKKHPRYTELLTLQTRLSENIAQSRRYGDTETRRAERARILESLNRLALVLVGVTFVELSESELVRLSHQQVGKESRTRILAVFANPRGSDPLRLSTEDRVIHECLQLSRRRDNISLDVLHAATIHDVRRALLNKDYRIVHFSGHGTGKGLAFEDELGHPRLIPQEALAEFLSAYSPPIECVILNACYTDTQGQLISFGVPYTIGMDGAISDEGATEFTRGFYDAIGAGKDVEFAYQEGCRTIKLMGLPDGSIPVLFKRSG